MLLPEPVSPTSASVVPAGTSRLTPVDRGAVAAGVGERDVLEPDVAAHPLRVDGTGCGRVVDVDRQVEVLEDPREQGQRADQRHADAQQPISGRNRPHCRAVKATRVPMVSVGARADRR